MKAILLIITMITFSIVGCQNSTKKSSSVETYQYPKDSLYNAKVFTFCNLNNPKSKMNVVHHVFSENDTTFFLKYSLERTGRDSSIYIKSDGEFKLSERFKVFLKGPEKTNTTLQGEILECFDSYLKNKTIVEFEDVNNPDVSIRIEGLSTLDSTMIYELQGKKIESVKYFEKTQISISHKFDSFAKSSFEIEGESILGKNIGMIYFKTKNKRTGEVDSWELESIIDYEKYVKTTGANNK